MIRYITDYLEISSDFDKEYIKSKYYDRLFKIAILIMTFLREKF